MINLPVPNRNELDDIHIILTEKRDNTIRPNSNTHGFLVDQYHSHITIEQSNRIPPIIITEALANKLRGLYKSKTKRAKEICTTIVESLPPGLSSECPYCGIGTSDELDHFLPKEHFPQYSILHKNLIPICGKCNKIKGENIPGTTYDYIHLYFDQFPSNRFLVCTIITTCTQRVSAQFTLTQHAQQNSKLQSHFTSLDLLNRYAVAAAKYLARIKALIRSNGCAYAAKKIESDKIEYRSLVGENNWKFLLCECMQANNTVAFLSR